MQAIPETITSGVDERRFLEDLKTFFSTSTTMLAECMQNARRAGASEVRFEYDNDSATLTITDNGSGIKDFQPLVIVSKSGWTEQTKKDERPFGIGFFSVCFAAERVRVQSLGYRISFSAQDLIEKRPISVEPYEYFEGTRIVIEGCKLQEQVMVSSIANYASGFDIPVFWKGEEQPRPYARAALRGTDTPVGFIHDPGIHSDETPEWRPYIILYCQGLPIHTSDSYRGQRNPFNSDHVIIHVDHKRYQPRMPDRDILYDSAQASKDFVAQIEALWREFLLKEKANLCALEFANTYWRVADFMHCLDVMCDVPVLPASQLSFVGSTPVMAIDGCDFMRKAGKPVTLEDVQHEKVELYRDFDAAEEGDYFARLTWAQEREVLFVSGLPKGHWAEPYLCDLFKLPIKISGRRISTQSFSGDWVSANVKIMENLSVTIGGIQIPMAEAIAVGDVAWGAGAILVPKATLSTGRVLRQASTYQDENESFRQDALERDQDSLDDLVAIMAGELPEKTIEKCLINADARSKSNLGSCSFHVGFDANNNITVTRCQAL